MSTSRTIGAATVSVIVAASIGVFFLWDSTQRKKATERAIRKHWATMSPRSRSLEICHMKWARATARGDGGTCFLPRGSDLFEWEPLPDRVGDAGQPTPEEMETPLPVTQYL